MKERPILFGDEMVRAILDGRKTQTRRPVKPQPPQECTIHYMLGNESWMAPEKRKPLRHTWEAWHGELYANRPEKYLCGVHDVRCPFGSPGDRLWVRETWAAVEPLPSGRVEYEGARIVEVPGGPVEIWYRADGALGIPCLIHDDGPRWSPSIHMPRWASRITLEITDVRVQRVQDITEGDALAEGIRFFARDAPRAESAKNAFMELWNSTYGEGAWERNEWVWAITFRRIEP